MTRSSRGIPAIIAVLGLAAFAAAPAQAKVKRHHGQEHYARAHPSAQRPANFPVYVDHGSDRNPGGDNLYFSDTKSPNYIVGPAWFQRWQE